MPSLSRSTILGVGLLAAIAATAYGQSVSTLPPNGGLVPPTGQPSVDSAPRLPGPNTGVSGTLPSGEQYQKPADWDSNPAYHPYSTRGTGPTPDAAGTSTAQHYEPPPGYDSATGLHPYSSGAGPRPH
jgi:hypothetical protein